MSFRDYLFFINKVSKLKYPSIDDDDAYLRGLTGPNGEAIMIINQIILAHELFLFYFIV